MPLINNFLINNSLIDEFSQNAVLILTASGTSVSHNANKYSHVSFNSEGEGYGL